VEELQVSISIGGANLAPQQLAAPQEKPAPAAIVSAPKAEPPSAPPPGTGQIVDKKA
jgi:hypothetical protein